MNRRLIKLDGYPCAAEFTTYLQHPPTTEAGLDERTAQVQLWLHDNPDAWTANHSPEDFIVEVVTVRRGFEIWHMGS